MMIIICNIKSYTTVYKTSGKEMCFFYAYNGSFPCTRKKINKYFAPSWLPSCTTIILRKSGVNNPICPAGTFHIEGNACVRK